tara:strand:- start:360 stop:878 length:519 start_codon:yes stop_codon:yes gene_type:complete
MGVTPPRHFLEGAMDGVDRAYEGVFETCLKENLVKAVHYFHMNSGMVNASGWDNSGSVRPDIVIGSADYSDDVPIEDALQGDQPELSTVLEQPVLDFIGRDPTGLGDNMQHYFSINPGSDVTTDSDSLDAFLGEDEASQIYVVPDQHDNEVFAFVVPKDDGYTLIRLRESPQ